MGKTKNEEWGMGCWRLEMANTNDNNFDMSVELKRGDAKI